MAKRPDHIPAGEPGPEVDPVLEGVKKGDLVRLLEAHYDGFQRLEAGAVVAWWNDTPPSTRTVAYANAPQTPLDAPPMTDGKPPADYVDPHTGKKPVIPSS